MSRESVDEGFSVGLLQLLQLLQLLLEERSRDGDMLEVKVGDESSQPERSNQSSRKYSAYVFIRCSRSSAK
jgi:hypothetical protein